MNTADLNRLAAGNAVDVDKLNALANQRKEMKEAGLLKCVGYRLVHPFAGRPQEINDRRIQCVHCDRPVDDADVP